MRIRGRSTRFVGSGLGLYQFEKNHFLECHAQGQIGGAIYIESSTSKAVLLQNSFLSCSAKVTATFYLYVDHTTVMSCCTGNSSASDRIGSYSKGNQCNVSLFTAFDLKAVGSSTITRDTTAFNCFPCRIADINCSDVLIQANCAGVTVIPSQDTDTRIFRDITRNCSGGHLCGVMISPIETGKIYYSFDCGIFIDSKAIYQFFYNANRPGIIGEASNTFFINVSIVPELMNCIKFLDCFSTSIIGFEGINPTETEAWPIAPLFCAINTIPKQKRNVQLMALVLILS